MEEKKHRDTWRRKPHDNESRQPPEAIGGKEEMSPRVFGENVDLLTT